MREEESEIFLKGIGDQRKKKKLGILIEEFGDFWLGFRLLGISEKVRVLLKKRLGISEIDWEFWKFTSRDFCWSKKKKNWGFFSNDRFLFCEGRRIGCRFNGDLWLREERVRKWGVVLMEVCREKEEDLCCVEERRSMKKWAVVFRSEGKKCFISRVINRLGQLGYYCNCQFLQLCWAFWRPEQSVHIRVSNSIRPGQERSEDRIAITNPFRFWLFGPSTYLGPYCS